MSGFEYYLRCPVCGLTSPEVSLSRLPWEAPEILLPAADLAAHAFTVVQVPLDEQSRKTPLWKLAQSRSDDRLKVTSPVLEAERIGLNPPIACPRCGAAVPEGAWGSPPPTVRDLRTIEDVIDQTRSLPPGGDYKFVSPEGGYWVECMSGLANGRRVNHWFLHRNSKSTIDLQSLAADLVSRLKTAGNRCEDLIVRQRNGSFAEWP